jgi:hypothetical protein
MAIKIKHKDPKATDFSINDIVINVNKGTIFYKTSNNDLHKIQGDNLSTTITEFLPSNLVIGDITISGSVVPIENDAFELGSPTKIWTHLHVNDESIKLYRSGVEVGKLSYVSGSGLRVRDKEGRTKGIISDINGGSF